MSTYPTIALGAPCYILDMVISSSMRARAYLPTNRHLHPAPAFALQSMVHTFIIVARRRRPAMMGFIPKVESTRRRLACRALPGQQRKRPENTPGTVVIKKWRLGNISATTTPRRLLHQLTPNMVDA